MVTSLSKPNSAIAMRTLRTKGEDGEKRKIIMASPSLQVHRRKVESTAPQVGTRQRDENWRPLVRAGVETRRLARDDQVDRLRTFALFVRLNVKTDVLPLRQRFQSCVLDGGDVNKHIAATVVGLNEPVAALTVEKLYCTAHCHRATPFPAIAAPRSPRRGGSAGHPNGQRASTTQRAAVTP